MVERKKLRQGIREVDDFLQSKTGLSLGSESALVLYLAFFITVNFAGVSVLSPSAWAPYSLQNTNAPQGSLWVEGDSVHWATGSMEYYFSPNDRSLVDGSSSGPSGAAWIEGSDFHFIDAQDDEFSVTGWDTGNDPSAPNGALWLEPNGSEETMHYIDANGNERYVDLSFGEAGLESGLNGNEWHTGVPLSANFASKPVMFATTQTTNGGQDPSAAHIRSVSMTSFDTQHCEFEGGDSCDGHAEETNGWVALDPNRVNSLDGMEVGTIETSKTSEDRTSVSFSKSFSNIPYVFAQVQSEHDGGNPRNVQVDTVDTSGFTLELCDQDGSDGCEGHGPEVVAWWAIDPGVANKRGIFDWGSVSVSDSNWNSVSFSTSYGSSPAVIAMTQTEGGGAEALYPEVDSVGTSGASVRYCESDAGDGCDTHATETVAWVSVATGRLYP